VIFHSIDFVVFLLVTVTLYWRLPHRAQNVLLVIASYFFYGYVHPWFVALVFATTVIDYAAARGMDERPRHKRLFLGLSLVANLGMLGFFKYFHFFLDNVLAVTGALGLAIPRPALQIVLPVGISFYTFQELTYTIDVYYGRLKARRDFIDVAAFVCFFPQLVAGPIERAAHLLPQVEGARRFSWALAGDALCLVLWGYFKKLVIADNVGVIANKVFALRDPGPAVLWAGVFAFSIQIFADFSAYSDIARGTARWFGFDLMRNFNHPYFARGPADFWHRWHISLSSWFRDYVYKPLGGSRRGAVRFAGAVLATFLLSGLWHGASWNYVLWGLYHGLLLLGAHVLARFGPRGRVASSVAAPLQVAITFVLVTIGWLFFRETEFPALVRDLIRSPFGSTAFDRQAGLYLFLLAAVYSIPIWIHGLWDLAVPARGGGPLNNDTAGLEAWRHIALRAAVCGVLVAMILVFRSRTSLDFIYFKF
jgi:D-alanyl-lipoteichoic acid acyltransferase DltB (MBOAT superfamily)